jgi:hypothetical protein
MRYSVIATAVCCFLITKPALSQQDALPPDERLDQEIGQEELEMRNMKEAQCMKAIGNQEFCSCIADESPSGIDFVDYVGIVLSRGAPLSAKDKALVDASMDKCVSLSTLACP